MSTVQYYRSNDTIITGASNYTINPGLGKYEYVDGGEGFDHLIVDYSVADTGGGMGFYSNYTSSGTGSAYRSSGVPNTLELDDLQFTNIEKFTVIGTRKDDTIMDLA